MRAHSYDSQLPSLPRVFFLLLSPLLLLYLHQPLLQPICRHWDSPGSLISHALSLAGAFTSVVSLTQGPALKTQLACPCHLQVHNHLQLNGSQTYLFISAIHKMLSQRQGWGRGRGWRYDASVQNWAFLSRSGKASKSRGGCSVYFASGL